MTRALSQDEINKIVTLHGMYKRGEAGGKRADLRGTNLSGADLSRADLSRADLSWADLSGVDFRWADLSGADLSGADLSGVDLSGADLSGADLSGAILREAVLSGADLIGAVLIGADLSEAFGDGVIIRSMQTEKYHVVVCDDLVCIGCEAHRIHEWADFDDATIDSMDDGAFDWWEENKRLVMEFAKASDFGIEV